MKNIFKIATLLLASIFITSCSDSEDLVKKFAENINAEKFKGIELGNSDFILPQSNIDVHVEFDYTGTSKVTKIFFDVEQLNVPKVNDGELIWEVKNHLVPVENYEGQLNPHIHYHIYFDEENRYTPSFKAAEGIYNFKITVEHEDGTKSIVTKQLNIVQKFKQLKVGENNLLEFGKEVLPTEFQYISEPNKVTEVTYELWFEEWRAGQNVEIGKWDKITKVLPKNLYEGVKNPQINYMFNLLEGSPKGGYWLNIYVEEDGEKERVKLSVPFKIN